LAGTTFEQAGSVESRVASRKSPLDASPLAGVWILDGQDRPAREHPTQRRCRLANGERDAWIASDVLRPFGSWRRHEPERLAVPVVPERHTGRISVGRQIRQASD